MMLLAPKTLWAMVNLSGWVGGKYGAKTHFSPQRRRRILQAAHGLRTTGRGEGGRVLGGEDWEGEGKLGEYLEGEDKLGENWEGEIEEDGELENGVGTVIGGVMVFLPLYSIFAGNRERERQRNREMWWESCKEEGELAWNI